MNNTINSVSLFLGGAIIGSFATVAVMKKLGYKKYGEIMEEQKEPIDKHDESISEPASSFTEKPSYEVKKNLDTHKVSYHLQEKPDPEELVRKYAEAEHPSEDDVAEDDTTDFPRNDVTWDERTPEELDAQTEEDIEEEEWQSELGEATMFGHDQLLEETEGFGHVITQLETDRRDQLIYLIPQHYAGEIYPLEELTYYERDEILADVADGVVNDVEGVIGDALDCFGQCGSERNMVFVRNCSLGVEYEITRVDGYYAAKLYGISDEEFEGGGMAAMPKSITKRRKATDIDEE